MHIETGPAVGPSLARSLAPVLRAVAACAGPQGRACLYQEGGGVAQAFTALDVVRQVAGTAPAAGPAALILRETLVEADRDLGDGGARLALLLGAVFGEGVRLVGAGVPAPGLADALLALGSAFDAALAAAGTAAADEGTLAAVAASAGVPAAVAADVARLLTAVGADGHGEIVAARAGAPPLETGSGFIFDAQAAADIFAEAAFDPVYLLVADEIVADLAPLVPLLEGFATRGKALLVVARDVTGPALQTLVRNARESGLRTAALKPAAVARHAADSLEDLAVATGATLVAERHGTSLAALRPAMLGRAARFSFSRGRALLEAPAGEAAAVGDRRRLLWLEAGRQRYLSLDRERLESRSARLSGRWGRLQLAEADGRAADAALAGARRALASARQALAGGVVAGGGVGLVEGFDRLPPLPPADLLAPAAAARHCLAVGLAGLVRSLAAQDVSATVLRREGSLGSVLGLAREGSGGPRTTMLDPLPLARAISRRALSAAATMLRADALLSS